MYQLSRHKTNMLRQVYRPVSVHDVMFEVSVCTGMLDVGYSIPVSVIFVVIYFLVLVSF